MPESRTNAQSHAAARPHLEGWKEIASYFGRTVRTLQRWERDHALPVRRHLHTDLSSVYADPAELDAWRASRTPPDGTPSSFDSPPDDESTLHAMAVDYWRQRSKDGFQKCIALCHAALERNSAFAPAYALLALAHQTRATYGHQPPIEDIRLARSYVARAVALAPDAVEAHQARMFIRFFEFDWAGARAAYQTAIALDPSNATTLQFFSSWLVAQNRLDEACEMAGRAEALGSWPQLAIHTAWMLHLSGRFEEAIQKAREVIRRDRHAWRGYFNLGLSLAAAGRFREAAQALEVTTALNDLSAAVAARAAACALAGDAATATRLLASLCGQGFVSPYWLAHASVALGDDDGAVAQLRRSAELHEWFLMFLKHEPAFARIRSLDGFLRVARTVGLP
jgi:tetratricopeptide (TPR) repeat protein